MSLVVRIGCCAYRSPAQVKSRKPASRLVAVPTRISVRATIGNAHIPDEKEEELDGNTTALFLIPVTLWTSTNIILALSKVDLCLRT